MTTVTWIALADRKPEQNQKVLVCAGKMVTAATYEAVPWPNESPWWMACEWSGIEWDFNFMDHEVTHWAPLPEPAISE